MVPYITPSEDPPNLLDLLKCSIQRTRYEKEKICYAWLHPKNQLVSDPPTHEALSTINQGIPVDSYSKTSIIINTTETIIPVSEGASYVQTTNQKKKKVELSPVSEEVPQTHKITGEKIMVTNALWTWILWTFVGYIVVITQSNYWKIQRIEVKFHRPYGLLILSMTAFISSVSPSFSSQKYWVLSTISQELSPIFLRD